MIHTEFMIYIWIIIPCITVAILFHIRTKYKIEQLKAGKKAQKEDETIAGGLRKLIDGAEGNIKQIDSEIATIQATGRKQGRTDKEIKELVARLNSERDMLMFPAKYGNQMKPFLKPLDLIVNNLLGKFTGK